MVVAQASVWLARSCFPAPIFCAHRAETVDSIEDGTRKNRLIIFSTMPTAAASFKPRRLAIMVMTMKAIWINPSCMAIGNPIFKRPPIMLRTGFKSAN